MIKKFPNSGIRIMQDVPQIEAFRIPVHVELTELLGFDFDLVQNCAREPLGGRDRERRPQLSLHLQWSAVRVTPSGIGKSVTVTDCHCNSSFPCQCWRVRVEPSFYPHSQL